MRQRHLLLVDDDDSLRALVRATLPRDAFTVSDACDGQEAIDFLRQTRPDLVVLDWKMPERSGEEVLEVLKNAFPDLPVVVLTAEYQGRERETAESLGADEFLTKPFSPLELLGTLDRLFGSLAPEDATPR